MIDTISFWTVLESISVLCSLTFLYFLIKEKIICWLWGIIASTISIAIFIKTQLYAESALYAFYVIIGIYGWYNWNKPTLNSSKLPITRWSLKKNIFVVVSGLLISSTIAYPLSHFTDANNPYIDSSTSVFGIIASILEANKILSTWIYWTIINGVTVVLYFIRGLEIYSLLMIVYTVVSILGWLKWKRAFSLQQNHN